MGILKSVMNRLVRFSKANSQKIKDQIKFNQPFNEGVARISGIPKTPFDQNPEHSESKSTKNNVVEMDESSQELNSSIKEFWRKIAFGDIENNHGGPALDAAKNLIKRRTSSTNSDLEKIEPSTNSSSPANSR